jgi:hypothetical protein
MTNNNINAKKTEAALRGLLAGLAKSPPTSGQLMLVGVTYALAAYQSKLQGYLAPFDTVHTAHHDLTAAVQARDAQISEVQAFIEASQQFLRTNFGSSNPVLADYGMTPKKPRAKATGAENAAKAAKAKATRAKNGTLGSEQKKALDQGTPPSPTTK